MKRLMALLLMLCIALTGMALAEDELYEEVDDSEFNEDAVVPVVGAVYPDKVLSDFDSNSPALYTARMTAYTSGYVDRDIESTRVFRVGDTSARGEVLYVDPTWVIMRYQGKIAYVKRHRIFSVTPVDSSTTPPYGTQKHAYVAKTATNCYVRKSMSDQDESWVVLNPGTTISIWCMYDGWAVVNYMRSYGYINLDQLTDLTPVSPTDNPLREDTPIAAYTSYYTVNDTEKIHNRIHNIARGGELISGVYQPGDVFDGNKIMGPYNKGKGYLIAGALSDGTASKAYGAVPVRCPRRCTTRCSNCRGINILYRRAHGRECRTVPAARRGRGGRQPKRRTFAGATTTTSRFASRRTPAATARFCMLIYRVYDEE